MDKGQLLRAGSEADHCSDESNCDESNCGAMAYDEDEVKHYNSVILAFREYGRSQIWDIARRDRHLHALPEKYKSRLNMNALEHEIEHLKHCVLENQRFYAGVTLFQHHMAPFGAGAPKETVPSRDGCLQSSEDHMSKLRSTLHQCVRDWAAEGEAERAACYGPLINEIQSRIPIVSANARPKVLVPGSGLGRLPLELAARGYAAQGNEFSYFMLLTSNAILNHGYEPNCFTIYPWIDQPSNNFCRNDAGRAIKIPDVSAGQLLSGIEKPDFSMVAGDFLDVYKDQHESWDCIATCFFLDTAVCITEYAEAIYRLLKPGGLWVNLGPLLYHWQSAEGSNDDRFSRSVELSYEDVRQVILSFGFKMNIECLRESPYTCNPLSMMKVSYRTIMFSATKPYAPESSVGAVKDVTPLVSLTASDLAMPAPTLSALQPWVPSAISSSTRQVDDAISKVDAHDQSDGIPESEQQEEGAVGAVSPQTQTAKKRK